MADADAVTLVPGPLGPRPDLERVKQARSGGHDRRAGEQFAIEAAQVLIDVRLGEPGARVLDALGASELPEDVRGYLVNDIDGQQAARTQRQLDTSAGLWIRSQSLGGELAPERLNVEVAGVLASKPLDFNGWHRERFDVAWVDGRWSLVGYSLGAFGPKGTGPLTAAQQRDFLPGKGWRRIPPA